MVNRDVIYSVFRNVAGSSSFFFLSLLVIRFSNISTWGNFIQLYLPGTAMVMLVNAGSKDFLLKKFSQAPQNMARSFWENTWLRLLLSLLLVVLLFCLPLFKPEEKTILAAFCLLRCLLSSADALLVYEKKFRLAAFIEVLSLLLAVAAIYYLHISHRLSPLAVFTVLLAADACKLLLLMKQLPSLRAFAYPIKPLQNELRQWSPYLLTGVISFIVGRADLYLLSSLVHDPTLIGRYHILNTVANLLMAASSSLLQVRSKSLLRVGTDKYKHIQLQYLRYTMPAVTAACLLFYLLSPWCFGFQPSLLQVVLILLYCATFNVYYIFFFLQSRVNQQSEINKVLMLAGLINILGSCLLVPIFATEGALTALVMGQVYIAWKLYISSRNYVNKHHYTHI